MGSSPLIGFKTTTVAPTTGGNLGTGKANAAPATPSTPATAGSDSYVDQLLGLGGYAPSNTTPPSSDPTGDLLATLDQISKQGVPEGNLAPFPKLSAESALSKFPDMPEDVLAKFTSIISSCQTIRDNLEKAMNSGTGTPQQMQAAQKFKVQLEDLMSYYTHQRDKVSQHLQIQEKIWTKEFNNFLAKGGSADVTSFDLDHDGWIGRPSAKGSYQVGERQFEKSYTDPLAAKIGLKSKFKKGETQSWAINPESKKRVQFDPITQKVVDEQIAAPGYTADMGAGFGDPDNDNVTLNDKGQLMLHTGSVTNTAHFAEAGLELHTPEYIYVEIDSEGNPLQDDLGNYKILPFEMKDGRLIQKTPPTDGDSRYKQIYVTKMEVASEGGDDSQGDQIVVRLYGGKDNENGKLMDMRIAGANTKANATGTALAITSGKDKGHRESPVMIDASSYTSTSRKGITDPKNFSTEFKYQGNKALGPHADQINDTLKGFVAKTGSSDIDSTIARNRGIAFQTKGHIIGTEGNDLFMVEEPANHLTPKDAAYTTVIEGGSGKNALFGKKGSLFASGMTLVSKESGDANDAIGIGVNAFNEVAAKDGRISSGEGKDKGGTKLYIHVNANNSDQVAIQSLADSTDKPKPGDAGKNIGWETGDDYFNIHAKKIGITAYDGNNPNIPFDPDMQTTKAHKSLTGNVVAAGTGEVSNIGSGEFSKRIDELKKAISVPATDDSKDDWTISGVATAVKSPYLQQDISKLDGFFAEFNSSKLKTFDPFFQVEEGEKQADQDFGGTI